MIIILETNPVALNISLPEIRQHGKEKRAQMEHIASVHDKCDCKKKAPAIKELFLSFLIWRLLCSK
jgi:hypothetical protein